MSFKFSHIYGSQLRSDLNLAYINLSINLGLNIYALLEIFLGMSNFGFDKIY